MYIVHVHVICTGWHCLARPGPARIRLHFTGRHVSANKYLWIDQAFLVSESSIRVYTCVCVYVYVCGYTYMYMYMYAV
jgi:hypothetical protein